jgi:type II secretory pathway component PulF
MQQIPGITQFVNNIAGVMITTVEAVLILIVITFGIQFILYSDNPQERSRLIRRIIWVLVGLFIVIGAQNFTTFIHAIVAG